MTTLQQSLPLIVALVAGLLLVTLHLAFWRWRLALPLDYAHVERITMPDGGLIELRRLGGGSGVPVLLIHGLAMNHRNHDTAEDASFARHLQRQGRDVWLLTSRSGFSPRSICGHRAAHFAGMVEHDVPRAVAHVLARTGAAQLDVAGFSMGGILLYATLDRTVDTRLVRRALVFAGPGKIRPLGLLNLSRVLPTGLSPSVPMRLMTHSFAFAPRLVPSALWRRLYNPANVDPRLERRMLVSVWEDIPGRLGQDFVRWSARGGEIDVNGTPILPGLAHVTVPVCFFAGSADWLAPVDCVRAAFDAWGSAAAHVDKHFVVLGREHGTCDDYGHCDISFGRHVTREVFEPAARFLARGVRERAARPDTHGVEHTFAAPSSLPAS